MSDLVNVDNKAVSGGISRNINNQANTIDEKFNQASNLFLYGDPTEWAGKDADAYKQKLEDLKTKVVSSIEEIRSLSKEILNQSNQIKELEDDNEKEIVSYA